MQVKEKPILFSGPMVRAILEGRKAQTRRIIKPQPPPECGINYTIGNESWLPVDKRTPLRRTWEAWGGPLYENRPDKYLCGVFEVVAPFQPGDTLWVRETLKRHDCWRYGADNAPVIVDADHKSAMVAWAHHKQQHHCVSIHMPRWACRIRLEVAEVRAQRLNEISVDDTIAEGVQFPATTQGCPDGKVAPLLCISRRVDGHPAWSKSATADDIATSWYALLWEDINGKGSWRQNPWVWTYTFKRL